MAAEEVYDQLLATPAPAGWDAFDRHVVAAMVSLAMEEGARSGQGGLAGLGLSALEFRQLLDAGFPGAAASLAPCLAAEGVPPDGEEDSIRDILRLYCSTGDGIEQWLIAMIARRCKAPHHLWQDLGLRDRGELSQLMRRHFAPLAEKNRNDMKWKKFLYRMVCGTEGFSLCTAPVCAECDDFAVCFGAEDGESRLARTRNGRLATGAEKDLPLAAE